VSVETLGVTSGTGTIVMGGNASNQLSQGFGQTMTMRPASRSRAPTGTIGFSSGTLVNHSRSTQFQWRLVHRGLASWRRTQTRS